MSPVAQYITFSAVPVIQSASGNEQAVRALAEEVPCAFRYNGFSHAVMMATPADLDDFVFGFSLTEDIICGASDIRRYSIDEANEALVANVELAPDCLHRFLAARRVRQLRGRTSCGVCGVEDLDDIKRPDQRVVGERALPADVIEAAVRRIRDFQPLSRRTRAAHAAAWVDLIGNIIAVREDIGRHNALDKLIGAKLQHKFLDEAGFCLITSRCSYEMSQKAITAGIGTLVSVSAPTAYAVRTAQAAGLALYSLSADGGQLLYTQSTAPQELPHVQEA
jgi:FdhD protein